MKEEKIMLMMMENMVHIHDEQQSIQMTILRRDTHKNTVQTSTVSINNGSKNSKCRPKSDTQSVRRGSNNANCSNNNRVYKRRPRERERDTDDLFI